MARRYSEDLLLEWTLGFDLLTRQPTYVPVNCVVCPYHSFSVTTLFYSSTNGLASGNTRLDALCHALCEVIERDAAALAMASADVRPAVASILADIGFDGALSPERADPPLISLRGLPRPAAALVGKLQRAGLEVQLRNLTSATGIPTIDCVISDPHSAVNAECAWRMRDASGCPDRADARADRGRANPAWIHSGRTGGSAGLRPAEGKPPEPTWNGWGETISFDDIASHQHASVNEDVEFILERMRQSGFDQVVVVDVTRAEVGIPVVRVVAPRAEAWTFHLMHGGRASLGRRALQQIDPRT